MSCFRHVVIRLVLVLSLSHCGKEGPVATGAGGQISQSMGGNTPACTAECTIGASQCSQQGTQKCEEVNGCGRWSSAAVCGADQKCYDGACVSCAGSTGTFKSVPFTSSNLRRYYFLHVPDSYSCESAEYGLWVDFQGTGGGTDETNVEEFYGTEDLVKIADENKFIVIRPRSRAGGQGATKVLQWDIHAGDLSLNKKFAEELIAFVNARYRINSKRMFVSGFSNGTNMAAQFLSDEPLKFQGFGIFAGGIWNLSFRSKFTKDFPRVYMTTGYRDYMYSTQVALSGYLKQIAIPAENILERESDSGHDLYAWHMTEAIDWFKNGKRKEQGLSPRWSEEKTAVGTPSLLAAEKLTSGELVATGVGGKFYVRDATGIWSASTQLGAKQVYVGICALDAKRLFAVGGDAVASSKDGGKNWKQEATLPEFGAKNFGYSYLNAIGCRGETLAAGGYWSMVTSNNAGMQFTAASALSSFGYASQVAAVKASASGTWVTSGYYNYIGRSLDGMTFQPSTFDSPTQWVNEVTPFGSGSWAAVGEQGTVLVSRDDGITFQNALTPTTEDLYGVDFANENVGMAIGAHGAAILTKNGGATWERVDTGLDIFLGDVKWLDSEIAVVVGESGRAFHFALNGGTQK